MEQGSKTSEKNSSQKITTDDVLKEIGEFGKYQFFVFCLVGSITVMCALATYHQTFTDATPQFRCRLPNYENDTYEISSPKHQELVDLYIPKDDSKDTYKGCSIRSQASLNAPEIDCDSWVYSKKFYERTIVTDWNLVCSNVGPKSLFQSLFFAGTFGVILIGILGDRFGRKRITYIYVCMNSLLFLFMTLSVNFVTDQEAGKTLFGVCRFLIGLTCNLYVIATVLAVEVVGPNYRLLANNSVYYFFILGEFIVLLFAYFVRDYRYLYICMTVMVSSLVTFFWLVPESVRFLIGRKQFEKADAIFKRIAKSNKKVYSFSSAQLASDETAEDKTKKVGFKVFFSNGKIYGRLAISVYHWFTNSFVYYGISLNITVLGGDPYLNFLYATIMEFLGVFASQFLLEKFGRKLPYTVNWMMIAGSLISIGFVPQSMSWLIIVFVLIAKMSISFNYNAISIITAESYPTVIRNSALSFCSSGARIASTIAPYVTLVSDYWTPLPFVIYGIFAAVAGITYFLFMPETKGIVLPENLSDIMESEITNLSETKKELKSEPKITITSKEQSILIEF